jgi:peptide/nickel transport system substrate-binding protein
MLVREGVRQRALARRLSRRAGLRAGALGAAGLAGAFALACGGGDSKKESNQATAAGGTQSAAQRETPKPGGIISQRIPTDPPSLDLHQVTTYAGLWPTAPAFNQLVQFDPNKPGDTPQDIIPDLAEKWEQPDATTLVFTLRKGVKFHDGSDFTAEDAKVQLEWIKKPPQGKTSPRSGSLVTVDAFETPDPATLRLKLSRPSPSLLGNLSSHFAAIGQAKDILANSEVGPKLIGTGPFKLKTYQRSNLLELEKNPSYFKPGLPYLDGLKFFILPDYTTALTNFIAGQYQMFFDASYLPSDHDRLKNEAGDKAETVITASYTRENVFLNARRMPYNDIRVRQAINLAIDRDAAITVVKQGSAVRGGYMAPKGAWTIGETELRKFDGYDKPDIAKAKQLLAAAGVQTPLDASSTSRTDFKDFAEFVKDQLAKIGINLKLTLADTATAQPVLQRGDFDIGPWVVSINNDDPDATFSEIATSKAVRNWSAVYDDEIDRLYEKQSQILDFNERKKVVQDLERRALSQHQFACLYFWNNHYGRFKSVRDFVFHESLYTNRRLDAAWLKT